MAGGNISFQIGQRISSQVYLGPLQVSMMEVFCENN